MAGLLANWLGSVREAKAARAEKPSYPRSVHDPVGTGRRGRPTAPLVEDPEPEEQPQRNNLGTTRTRSAVVPRASRAPATTSAPPSRPNYAERRDAAYARTKPHVRNNPYGALTTKDLYASLGSGARGGTGSAAIPALLEEAKVGDAAERKKTNAAYIDKVSRKSDAAWSRIAKTRELTAEEWRTLTPAQQREIELNGQILSAIETNKGAGNTKATDTLREALGIEDDEIVSSEEFASGMTAIRESDLFGKGNMRSGAGVLVDGEASQAGGNWANFGGLGTKDPPAWTLNKDAGARQRMIASISQGVEDYFAASGVETPSMDVTSLDSTLGRTTVVTESPEMDAYLAEMYQNTLSKTAWQSYDYDRLISDLENTGIGVDLFMQYAGEKTAQAEEAGTPLAPGDDILDIDTYKTNIGLTETDG